MSALGGKGLEGRSVKGLPSVSLQPDMFGFLRESSQIFAHPTCTAFGRLFCGVGV